MKKQLYIFGLMLAMISGKALAFDELTLFSEENEKSKWMLLEKKFVTNIAKKSKTTWSHISALVPASFAAFAGYQYMNIDAKTKEDDDFIKNLRKPSNIYAMLGILSTSIVASQYLDCYLSAQDNRNAVADFFANWDQNQYFVPVELEEAFDILAEMIELQGQEAVLKHADEIVDAIQFLVTRYFESRYKNTLEAKGRDALNDSKLVIESFKNFFDGSKHLTGLGK